MNLINYIINKQFGGKDTIKWNTLKHNGVLFPPEYVPHNKPLKYNNQYVKLTPLQEEYAMLFVKYFNSEYIKYKQFTKNFWNDYKELVKDTIIKDFNLIDFSEYYDIYLKLKEQKKTEEQKIKDKLLDEKYKYAYVDNKKQIIGNYKIEPPNLFIGRGGEDNPKLGKIKFRIKPEDIILNIGKNEIVPNLKWKQVIHNQYVEWLASWKDNITGKIKYIWLNAESEYKMKSDMDKFELARKLKKKYNHIINTNNINLKSENIKLQQIATAFYFIDKFAIRVGNEKKEDEADTVGVSCLRVEHITLKEPDIIILDFLGKDCVPYYNEQSVDIQVYNNLNVFIQNKNPDDQIFDLINSTDINTYLQNFMSNLTAKVFRTFHASVLFQKEILKIISKYKNISPVNIEFLIGEYNHANVFVAKILNHQKNIKNNSSFKDKLDKITNYIKKIKKLIQKAKNNNNQEKILLYNNKLKILKQKLELKKEINNLALNTSKLNYIDPRITISFMKTFNIPIDKLFSKTLQSKFSWALSVDADWRF